ncbi:peptide ABC transporter ATP-binding protein [Nocardia mangyaensis]|uniref:Peptide ABC transporter ATP-binding protein n=1 Tax=Nocardia mangyaensis TaxID=2213200 RepID=A0A1J0VSF6_9NOCA|nr:ATP-binding cassette domain-containing protein [Nocardia mangyaensis]APE34946.1 peptide ABC transporter ATP-binding protein [Nocardia mangyaensis]
MTLLDIRDLTVTYPRRNRRTAAFTAVRDVSLDIRAGETVGLVGGSGSGKTTIGRAVLGLAPVTQGSIAFDGEDISHITRARRRRLGSQIQVIFQDPYTSLNPSMTIADILTEPLTAAGRSGPQSRDRVAQLLDAVGLPADAGARYASEFSGGQRQRVAIARAFALQPRLIVCDEPVSALDLSTQDRVLRLLVDIQEQTGVAYLFVSHDLSVVRHISHRVAVMCQGEIVESGPCAAVTESPQHPFTRDLLFASPVADPARQRERRRQRAQTHEQRATEPAAAGQSTALQEAP